MRFRALRSDLIDPAIAAHRGRIVRRTGDGNIVEFRNVVDAVRCAVAAQSGMLARNAGLPPERRIQFYVGDAIEESDGDLMGDGINIAARLQRVAGRGRRHLPRRRRHRPLVGAILLEQSDERAVQRALYDAGNYGRSER
jgi:class 3 adenylate cyclase